MRLYVTLFATLFWACIGKAQYTGYVKVNSSPLQDATVYNLNNKSFSLTNANGEFQIKAGLKDTLLISHIAYGSKKIALSNKNVSNRKINPVVFEKSANELDAVYIDNQNDAVRLGLPNAGKEVMTRSERRLNAAGDVPIWALPGFFIGAVPLETVINKITGKTKELKQEVATEKQLIQTEYLTNKYYNLFVNRWKMDEQTVQQYLYFVSLDKDFERQVKNPESRAFQFYLTEQYLLFQEIKSQENED